MSSGLSEILFQFDTCGPTVPLCDWVCVICVCRISVGIAAWHRFRALIHIAVSPAESKFSALVHEARNHHEL